MHNHAETTSSTVRSVISAISSTGTDQVAVNLLTFKILGYFFVISFFPCNFASTKQTIFKDDGLDRKNRIDTSVIPEKQHPSSRRMLLDFLIKTREPSGKKTHGCKGKQFAAKSHMHHQESVDRWGKSLLR